VFGFIVPSTTVIVNVVNVVVNVVIAITTTIATFNTLSARCSPLRCCR
jgi:hypothetical protein